MHGILLLSGGIDSPVAGYLLGRQAVTLTMVYFEAQPDETDKVKQIMCRMDDALAMTSRKVIVPHRDSLRELSESCRRNLTCVLCRRLMFRVAGKLAAKYGASFIITGESLGQVASQTLKNIFVEEEAASLPVLRPLIGMDKLEIEKTAKSIGTYDISIASSIACDFAPDKPSTASSLPDVVEEEAKVSLDDIVEREVENAREVA